MGLKFGGEVDGWIGRNKLGWVGLELKFWDEIESDRIEFAA